MADISLHCRRRHCSSRKLKQKFPDKLWSVVCDENEDSCMWNTVGDSLLINKNKFSQRFLTNSNGLFRTSKFKSFVRQLNLYGFRKVNKMRRRDHEIWWQYQNENFTRDHPELLKLIKRKANLEDYYDCGNCSKPRNRRKFVPAPMDLRLALLDDSCDKVSQEQENEVIKEKISDNLPINIGSMNLTFSDDEESRPALDLEPFTISIPLSQKQMWENNENYLTFSLFPDLPSSQEANPQLDNHNDENISPSKSENSLHSEYSF